MTLTDEPAKRSKTDKNGRINTSIWILPEVLDALEHRLIELRRERGRKVSLYEGIEEAIREWLAPRRVIHYDVLTSDEQQLVDGVLDMVRNAKHPIDRKTVEWIKTLVATRKST